MAHFAALTGATGFVGGAIARALLEAGWRVRVLARGPAAELERIGAEICRGSLEDADALRRLVTGVEVVVHCAGLVQARTSAQFQTVNAEGTARLAHVAAAAVPSPRFLLISSLAARAPAVSPYAASKRAGEEALAREGTALDFCIVRPPAVYGPGDRATLPLFAQLARGLLLVPAARGARFSLLFVDDVADAVVRLLQRPSWNRGIIEIGDGGYTWNDVAACAGRVVGKPVRFARIPRAVAWLPVALMQGVAALFGRSSMVTLGKLREMCHADWVSHHTGENLLGGWKARTGLSDGLSLTLSWYREHGWV